MAAPLSHCVQGNISMGDLTSVLPFGNQIAIIRIQGSDLIQAIHNGVSAVGYTSSTGRFLQVRSVLGIWFMKWARSCLCTWH